MTIYLGNDFHLDKLTHLQFNAFLVNVRQRSENDLLVCSDILFSYIPGLFKHFINDQVGLNA